MSGYVIVVSAVRTTYKPSRFMKTKSKKEAASIGTSLKKKLNWNILSYKIQYPATILISI